MSDDAPMTDDKAAIRAELEARLAALKAENALLRAEVELAQSEAELASIEAEAVPDPLSHDEQVAILKRAIVELRPQGWKEWAGEWPEPYGTSLRKGGIFNREFMTIWVEADGQVMLQYAGGVGMQIVPFVFFGD